MGGLFSEPSVAKYKPEEYEKIRPGKFVYKKDKRDVYWRGDIVSFANGLEFTDMGSGYGKDKKNIYYEGKTIGTLYPKFRVLPNGYAKDNRNVYFRGRVTTADPVSFQVLKNKDYAKDVYGQFYKGNNIKGRKKSRRRKSRRRR